MCEMNVYVLMFYLINNKIIIILVLHVIYLQQFRYPTTITEKKIDTNKIICNE